MAGVITMGAEGRSTGRAHFPRAVQPDMVLGMRRVTEASLFAVAAWLLFTRAHAPVHLDTARDLLIARDCVEGGACHFEGPLSSFARLAQGATWIHLLEAARWTGAGVHAIEAAVGALLGIAVGLVYFLERPLGGRRGALVAGFAFAGIVPFLIEHPVLWNPSLLPLPSVVFFAAQRAFVRRRSAGTLLAAALALGLIVDVHLVGILLSPGLIAPVLATPSSRSARAWIADLACVAAAPAFVVASSFRAVADDAHTLAGRAPTAAALVVALAVVTALLVRRIEKGGADAAASGTAAAYALLLAGGSLIENKPTQGWYWAPLAPALAVLASRAFVTQRRSAWIHAGRLGAAAGVLLGWVGVLSTLLPEGDEAAMWTLADAERCARALAARGFTVDGALRDVDAEYGVLLVSPLSAFLPAGEAHGEDRVLLQKRRGGAGVPLDGGYVAVMSAAPKVDFARGERCVDGTCAPLRPAVPGLPGFAGLAYPRRWALDPPPREDTDYALAYVLPTLGEARLTIAPDLAGRWELAHDERGRIVVRTTIPRGELWRDGGWPPALRAVE
jgi:hypothetical protein